MVSEISQSNENVVKKSKSIADAVTKEDVQIIINRALGSSKKLISYSLEKFPGDSLGFMAAHQNLVITVQDEVTGQEEHSFFVKSIPYGVDSQVSLIEDAAAFRKETTYYKTLIHELNKNVKDKPSGAECFLVKNDVMVFENLKPKNFRIKGKFLDIVSVKAALLNIAKFHAASMLAEKRLGKNLLELYPEILRDRLFIREGRTYDWYRTGVKVAVAVAEYLKLDSTLIPQVCDRIYDAILPSKSMTNGVCHGDLWSNNLLFNDSESITKCVIVDYQLIRYAPIISDVSLLLHLTCRREFRDKHEAELLMHYHEVLCEKLQENDYGNELPTLENVLWEYEQLRLVGIVTALLYFPVIQMEGEESSGATESSDNYSELLFKNRDSLVLDVMQRDPVYRKKITEIVEEIVQRADHLLKQINN